MQRKPLEAFFKEGLSESIAAYPEQDFQQLQADYYHLSGWDEEGIPPEDINEFTA